MRGLGEAPRLVLTLAGAGLLSGLAIVSAYRLTLPTIRANQAAALERAVLAVLPGSAEIQRLVWRGGEVAPAARGFSLGESELVLGGNIDPYFRGNLVAALTPENEVEVEEAFTNEVLEQIPADER